VNSRERIRTTLKKRLRADRVPWTFNFGATQGFNPGLLSRFKKHMGIRGPLADYFDYDIYPVLDPDGDEGKAGLEALVSIIDLNSNGIRLEDYYDPGSLPQGGYLDAWGIYHHPWPGDVTFEVYIPPLKNVTDLRTLRAFPSPTLDAASLQEAKADIERIKSRKQKMTVSYCGSVYEWTKSIRGEDAFFVDLYENPEFVETLVEKVADFTLSFSGALQAAGLDVLSYYDDFGAQDRLQISPRHWRRFIKPAWARIWKIIKERNKDTIIFLHSCGCVEEVIPDLIEIGLDVLHPIQPETMDVYRIASQYQSALALWGTISCQKTLPLGKPEDVEREIAERVERIGSKGAFMVSPANIMGPDVPLQNIEAFFKACQKYCAGF
jgi:uroporphyrinogen decarboxylase